MLTFKMKKIIIKTLIRTSFLKNPKEKEISFKELSELRLKLQEKSRRNDLPLYILYSKDDLINLSNHYSEIVQVDFENQEVRYSGKNRLNLLMRLVPKDLIKNMDKYLSKN